MRRLFRIGQDSNVSEYVEKFAKLYDQLTVYDSMPAELYYTTRFIDGMNPGVQMAVALQKPQDLDSAYELAMLHEELG